jgi:G3E family GTPase
MEVVEITGGCICCQIGVDLVRALRDLEQEFRPDLVIVEASGIATPEGVLDSIRRYPPKTLETLLTVTVVDPTRYEALHEVLTPLIEGQISGADCLVVTKADEAAPEEMAMAAAGVADLAPDKLLFVVDSLRPESLRGFLAWVSAASPSETEGGTAPPAALEAS